MQTILKRISETSKNMKDMEEIKKAYVQPHIKIILTRMNKCICLISGNQTVHVEGGYNDDDFEE